jgi:hypothetical protein
MRDRETWHRCLWSFGGLRQRKDTLLSKMRDRETWQDAGGVLGVGGRAQTKKRHTAL